MQQKHFIIAIISLFTTVVANAQVYDNSAQQREMHYLLQVKQIDEFFERFNFLPNTLLLKELKKRNKNAKINRADVLKALIDVESASIPTALADDFVKQIANSSQQYLHYNAKDWFAEASGLFVYKNSLIEIPIILFSDYNKQDSSYKWIVSNIQLPKFLEQNPASPFTTKKDIQHNFIDPSSNAANFISLQKAFVANSQFCNFYSDAFLNQHKSKVLYHLLSNRIIQLVSVKSTKYHFFGIDNWYFVVENKQRNHLNSGWLISELYKVNNTQKQAHIHTLNN